MNKEEYKKSFEGLDIETAIWKLVEDLAVVKELVDSKEKPQNIFDT